MTLQTRMGIRGGGGVDVKAATVFGLQVIAIYGVAFVSSVLLPAVASVLIGGPVAALFAILIGRIADAWDDLGGRGA